MKNTLLSLSLIAGLSFSSFANSKFAEKNIEPQFVPNQLIVKLKQGPLNSALPASLLNNEIRVKNFNSENNIATIEFDNRTLESMSKQLLDSNMYEHIEKNYIYSRTAEPNDPNINTQWYIRNNSFNAADLNMIAAWDIQANAANILVVVIDDGFDLTHPDLQASFINNGKCFASDAEYCGGTTDAGFTDPEQSHGTLVSGTFAAAANNGIGIAGASWDVDVLPIKSDFTTASIIQAVDEAIAQNASIINMSFGGPSFSQLSLEAYERALAAGILLVTSAGNGDQNNDKGTLVFPANYDLPNMISVGASSITDDVASFSQWGSTSVDIAAPGQAIFTTSINGGYSNTNGTSFSSPLTAGIAALIKAKTGATDYKQIKAQLLSGGEDNIGAPRKTAVIGRTATGRLDAVKALTDLTTGVIVIQDIAIDDSITGNNNQVLDPGETADIVLTLSNIWTEETNVVATLTNGPAATNSGNVTITSGQNNVGTIAQDGTATATFTVSVADFIGNENDQFILQLASDNGTLPNRAFYHEISKIIPGQLHTQTFQRWNWDEYHGFHVDVPAGATNLVIETTTQNAIDIDLLVRFNQESEYNITINPAEGSGFFINDGDTVRSAGADGNENVTIAAPQAGTYHIVIINFAQIQHDYTVQASFDAPIVPAPGEFNFDPSTLSVDEDTGTATFNVTRSNTLGAVSVDYSTTDGTAIAGEDFTATTGTLNWTDGDSATKTFTVGILDDAAVETAQSFMVNLSNATGGASLGTNSVATVTINDDDAPGTLQFSTATATISEATATASITVTRTGGNKGAASIDYATANGTATAGSDYTATNGTLNWADGDNADKTFTVSITNDTTIESNETISINLSGATVATLGATSNMTLTITDNDTPPPSSGGGGGGSMAWFIPLLLLLRLRKKK